MPLSEKQHAKLEAIAKERGLDVAELVAQAEGIIAERDKPPSGVKPSSDKPPAETPAGATSPEQPKLFQYHLPFVTVNEVRERWLGLDKWSADQGGDDNAAAFAAKSAGATPGTTE